MATPTTPAQIAATLEARYPTIGERAQKAAQLYTAGEVHPLPTSKILKDDRWKVAGYVASIAGKYCTCPDEADAPKHNGGPLCEHRIAAMMQQRLGAPASQSETRPATAAAPTATSLDRLIAIFAAGQAVGAEQVRLRVRVGLTWDRGSEQANICEGYLLAGDGRTWERFEASAERAEMHGLPQPFRFALAELGEAMDRHGWQFGTKNRSSGGGAAPRFGIQGEIVEIWYCLTQRERDRQLAPALRTHIGAVAA